MKKFLFLMLGLAVAVSASAGVNRAPLSKNIAKYKGDQAKVEQVVRKAAPGTVSTPFFASITRADVPEGYAQVTLAAGDVWGDGSGYQMLLDDDATAYGNEIPTSGAMTSSGDASETVYAAFEYKIPENADGSLTTSNIVMNNSVTILIPAGTYDWVITNPTPNDRMWIASANGNVGGRFDDYVFKSGCAYTFTVTLGADQHDQVDVVIDDPTAPVVPEITVTPTDKTAYVEWNADANATGWNLRWRPWTDLSGNPVVYDLNLEDLNAQLAGWSIYDADGDEECWEPAYSSSAQDDACFFSASWNGSDLTPDNWLFSPDVDFTEGTKLEFTIWGPSDNWPDNMMVYAYIYGATEEEDQMVPLFENDLQTTATKTTYTVELGQYAGLAGYIIFRHYNCTGMYYLYLDDIFIGDPNNMVEPAEWNYEYNIPDPNFTIRGLIPQTKYEVQVQGYNATQATDWCDIVEFTTLAPNVYMLGGDDQGWDPTDGSKMFTYDAENNIYTMTYTFPAEVNYFGFTTELSENNDEGGWAYIEPYRFGAISEGDFWYEGQEYVALTWDEYHAIRIDGGEYKMTLDLADMKLYIEKVEQPAVKIGDVDNDGEVAIADVAALIDYLLGNEVDPFNALNADVDQDGEIAIADVAALIDLLLAQ